MVKGGSDNITIGALLPLTGTLASIGIEGKVGLEMAIEDVNRCLAKNGSAKRLFLAIEDIGDDPEKAIDKLRLLKDKGARIVIHGGTEQELSQLRSYALSNGIQIVNYRVNSTTLSIENNTLFRLVPTDDMPANSISRQFYNSGVLAIVPLARCYLLEGGMQDLSIFDISSPQYDSTITENVTVREGECVEKVGIYLISFDQVVPIFAA
jgi:branched-chain amino acid transport system substrate-binding protein